MKPAFHFFLYFPSYSVLMVLAFLAGWLLARARTSIFAIPRRDLDNLVLMLPIAGLVGARIFARLFYARLHIWEALKVGKGDGLVFYGGFLFCLALIIV
jgi:prolipoprotein diacylglyceryltransferase